MTVQIERENERIRIISEFRDKELVKSIPGKSWDKDEKIWRVPLSWAACVQLRGTFRERLAIGPELHAWATRELQSRVQPCLELRDAADAKLPVSGPNGNFELMPFQRAGVAFLATAGQAICADEMGTGKTVQTIMTLETLAAHAPEGNDEPFPALIVCPNSMKFTWLAEFARWAPHRTVVVVHGGAQKRRKQLDTPAHAYIINWELLQRHSRLAPYGYIKLSDTEKEPKELNGGRFRAVVADEAHRAKSPKTKQTRALWAVGDPAQFRYALTGTPIANTPEDLWSVARFVAPKEWPSKTTFIDRYTMSSWSTFGFNEVLGIKAEMRDELFKILDPRFIRRPKEAVLAQLPPRLYEHRYVELSGKQKKAYEDLRKHLMVELESGTLVATNPLKRLTRLVQLAAAYGELEGDEYRLSEPSSKIDALEDIVDELGGEQAVIFAESRQLIELAAARLARKNYAIGQITGAVQAYDRQRNIDAFQAGQLQLMLCTLGAGSEGITLTAASRGIFLQRAWSSVKNLQAEGRLHRHGQEAESVLFIDLIAKDTIEDRVLEVRHEKAEKLEEITRDVETVARWLAK